MNTAIILIGSNIAPYHLVASALAALKTLDPHLIALPAEQTHSIDHSIDRLFVNQLVQLKTPLSTTHLKQELKRLEKELAPPRDHDRIPLDIDLITFNHEMIKAKELSIPYVSEGLKRLQQQANSTFKSK